MTTYSLLKETCKPIVNLNGSSADSLIETRIKTRSAIQKAIEALAEVMPHGRDYIGHDEQFQKDCKIQFERFSALRDIYEALEKEALAIQDQQK